jgi:hypothetical protein
MSMLRVLLVAVLAAAALQLCSAAYLIQYGTPDCDPASVNSEAGMPIDLLAVLPAGYDAVDFLPNFPDSFTNATSNLTSFIACADNGDGTEYFSTTNWYLYANQVYAAIGQAPALPTVDVATIASMYQVSSFLNGSAAPDTCLAAPACFGGDQIYPGFTGTPGPYNTTCVNGYSIRFNCGAATAPPSSTSSALGDPQLHGLRGQSFQVHGVDGAVYALISAPSLQVNSRFSFLSAGVCPPAGQQDTVPTLCWSHPGSYMGSVSVQQVVDGQLQTVLVEAGAAARGFQNVTVSLMGKDGEQSVSSLATGQAELIAPQLSVHRSHSNRLSIRSSLFTLQLDNSDRFLNLQLTPRVALRELERQQVHGLLGHTWSTQQNTKGSIKEVEGDVDDYAIDGNQLTGSRFLYTRFQLDK